MLPHLWNLSLLPSLVRFRYEYLFYPIQASKHQGSLGVTWSCSSCAKSRTNTRYSVAPIWQIWQIVGLRQQQHQAARRPLLPARRLHYRLNHPSAPATVNRPSFAPDLSYGAAANSFRQPPEGKDIEEVSFVVIPCLHFACHPNPTKTRLSICIPTFFTLGIRSLPIYLS